VRWQRSPCRHVPRAFDNGSEARVFACRTAATGTAAIIGVAPGLEALQSVALLVVGRSRSERHARSPVVLKEIGRSCPSAAPDFFQDYGSGCLGGRGRGDRDLAAIGKGVRLRYRWLRFRQAQIAIGGRVMVRSHFVAGRHFSEGYAFLCLTQIAFRFTHPLASNPDKFRPAYRNAQRGDGVPRYSGNLKQFAFGSGN
jgi:hypothetical protein